jgi:hypothetical protein
MTDIAEKYDQIFSEYIVIREKIKRKKRDLKDLRKKAHKLLRGIIYDPSSSERS